VKRETIDLSVERTLITLLLMSDVVCTKIIPIIKPQYMQSAYSREIVAWVMEYYEKYKEAPKDSIQSIFEQKRAYVADEEVLTSIGEFLGSLSDDYDPEQYTNIDYFVDNSEKYIRRCSVSLFKERLEACMLAGEIEKAEQLIATYTQPGIPQDTGIDILHDHAAIIEALTTGSTPLFTIPGDLGLVCNDFYRGDVSCWLGRAKAGKSWATLYTGEQAMMQGCKVTYVSLEMRKEEAIGREAMSLQWETRTPRTISVPSFHSEREAGELDSESTVFSIMHDMVEKEGINLNNLEELENQFKMRTGGGGMKFFFMPAEATTIETIDALLDNLMYYQGWNTDVLLIDYADLMSAGNREVRHGLDYIFRNLRRIAQVRNIHISTPSQSNYVGDKDDGELSEANVAEDKRKLGHVAKLLALYNTKEERSKGILHVKSIVDRYEPKTYDTAIVLQCLAMGKFCVDSKLSAKVTLQ